MRRTPPAAFLLLALALALAAIPALAIDPNASLPLEAGKTSWGTKRPFRVDDAGNQYVIPTGPDGGAVQTVPGTGPDGYRRITASTVAITCPSAGTTGYKLSTDACFECNVANEAVNVCEALNCATLGYALGVGARYKTCFTQTATGGADAGPTSDYSCRSVSGTGTISCVPLR